MSSEQNKAIVRRLFEEPWKGELNVVDELTAGDYVGHDPSLPGPVQGPEGIKEFISTYLGAFPDARITVEEQLAEGNLVATRWSARGMHEGALMDIEPSGKVVEEFQNWDFYGMMRQVEGTPALARA